MCSEKTIYNYIDACLFDVRNIDLPRKVKFSERYKKPEFKVDKGCHIGRNYKDFESFIAKKPDRGGFSETIELKNSHYVFVLTENDKNLSFFVKKLLTSIKSGVIVHLTINIK